MREIYIIDDEKELKCELQKKFARDKMFKFKRGNMQDLDSALKDIPALIIINEDGIQEDVVELCRKIRDNDDNAITPIIVISSNQEKEHKWEILKATASYVIKTPIDIEMMYYTIVNIIELLYINRKVSPLTSLPGNVQIQAEMKKRLAKKEYFVMLYIDLDNFKAYNDTYGFSNGDEIIKFTARTIVENIHKMGTEDSFIGHIGGDDFVAITGKTDYEKICKNIISDFDTYVLGYYSDEDVQKGYIEVANRRGIIEQFPLTSISIGVVEITPGRFKNTLEIGEVGAQVKHQAKSVMGSTYIINRRKK